MAITDDPLDFDPSAVVQLGMIEVEISVLDAAGEFLDAFTNNLLVHPAFVTERAVAVPMLGWRVIATDLGPAGEDEEQTLAAPHPSRVDAWVLATRVPSQDDFTTYRYEPDPVFPVPSKEDRRRQLALRWPASHSPDSTLTELRVELVNVSDTEWTPTARDDFYVTGVIEGGMDGSPVDGGQRYAYYLGEPAPAPLAPGARRTLRVDIDHDLITGLAPGRYLVTAVLVCLDLASATGVATRAELPGPPATLEG